MTMDIRIRRSVTLDIPRVQKELHEALEEEHIVKIHNCFENQEGKRLTESQLRSALYNVASIDYTNTEFEILFQKINLARDGLVSWDEFISYLILAFQQEEIKEGYESLEPPIPTLPLMMRSNHRHTVNKITFSPTVKPDRTKTWHDGSVMTCSKDGVINYWSLDMHLERQVQSICPLLKIQTTWVLDMVVLPDVSIVCTAGSERDLRFYDTSARKFELRVMISSLDYAVCAMHYVFSTDVTEESKLILGDLKGNIRVLFIQSQGRGPFKSTPGIPLLHERFEKIVRNLVVGFRYIDFGQQHTDFVRQMDYYPTLHSIVSCAQCTEVPMLMKDITDAKDSYVYKIPSGVWCFAIREGVHVFATGGPDCLVRLWNPFMRNKPTAILYGHHMGIVKLVLQDRGKRLYSLSKDKCIKVWDVASQVCLQTYLSLPPELGEYSELTTMYNPESRQWIIGSSMIAVIPLSPKQDGEHTDGSTHIGGISVILYNELYKNVVTCGLDSYIIVWNPWDGRRMCVVKDAHTRILHGEYIPIEITAAAFDPGFQRLLTAAHDGTLKVWNFNTGTCLRNMTVTHGCEITSVIWVKGRMMSVGWNRRVTEFADGGDAIGPGGAFCKNWDLRHKEDISCSTVRVPQTLATATYNGELIFWRLETGQAYKQYNVSDPTSRIKIQYKVVKEKGIRGGGLGVSKKARKALTSYKPQKERAPSSNRDDEEGSARTKTPAHTPKDPSAPEMFTSEECIPLRPLAVHCMIFLSTRPVDPAIGTLLVALENGTIQVWSHHDSGGFLTSFNAVHKTGDYVISMCTSKTDEYLFTGTCIGYVKVWLLKSYCTTDIEYVCMPLYRQIFSFLWRDVFVGRAKRLAKTQPFPRLMSSVKAHRMSVSGIIYIDEAMIFVTTDSSARMWTLGCRYIQTIGTFKPWHKLEVGQPVTDAFPFTFPPDIKRTASSTTFRVLNGGTVLKELTKTKLKALADKDMTSIDYTKVYGKRLEEPILGVHYKLPDTAVLPPEIKFDTSFPYIPVYQHLVMPQPVPLIRPPTPPRIKEILSQKIEKARPPTKS